MTTTTTTTADASPDTEAAERRARARRNDVRAKRQVRAVAVGAALLSLLSTAAPTGLTVVDALWCAGAAAGLALVASRATRNTWLWMTAVATAASLGSWTVVFALGALLIAGWSTLKRRRPRVPGAAIGALSATALLTLPDLGGHGLCSLVVVVAVAPVVRAAYTRSPRRVRMLLRRTAGWSIAAVVVAGIGMALAAALAARPMVRGVDDATAGLDALRAGEQVSGAASFAEAETSFSQAERLLTGPWTWPARLVPVMSQHAGAAAAAASTGADLAESAEVAASVAPYRDLKARDGEIDIEQVLAWQGPVHEAALTLERAEQDLADVRSPWLVAPADSLLDRLDDEIADALPEARLADQSLQVAPGLLGAEGDRRYLVLFTSPAETRNLGGFAGSYGVLEARDGTVDITVSGGISELARSADHTQRAFLGLDEWLVRYGRYQPERFFQNLTASPDMESTANATAQMYLQTTGDALDGVIVADPFALAALLELTGPVEVDSIEEPLTADNAAQFLLVDQYVRYEGEREARKDRLEDAGRATFEALTERELPNPRQIGKVLGPAVDEKHLMFFPFEADEQDLMEEVGALGRFEVPEGSDFLSVRQANFRPNKIDTFLHRTVDYEASYDPATGQVDAVVEVTFRNDAPPGGLPDYIIGPEDPRYPLGTTRIWAAVFTPLLAGEATVDDVPVGLEPQVELGANVYSAIVEVAPGASATLRIPLSGTIEGMGDTYELLASVQPLANDDTLSVEVGGAGGTRAESSSDMQVVGGRATDSGPFAVDRRYSVVMAR